VASEFPTSVSLLRAARKQPIWVPGPGTRTVAHEPTALGRILPQGGSWLLLDLVDAVDLEQRAIRARRRMRHDDPAFTGHFPGDPVYPAALQLELLGQAGLCAVEFAERASAEIPAEARPRKMRVIKVHHGLLLAEIHPGEETTALARVLEHDEMTSIFIAQLLRGDTVCAATVLEIIFLDR
jgi:3-hydroxymyristoyl/3-hydroxydecanoyl-(acyl carrier protein) dehydratase